VYKNDYGYSAITIIVLFCMSNFLKSQEIILKESDAGRYYSLKLLEEKPENKNLIITAKYSVVSKVYLDVVLEKVYENDNHTEDCHTILRSETLILGLSPFISRIISIIKSTNEENILFHLTMTKNTSKQADTVLIHKSRDPFLLSFTKQNIQEVFDQKDLTPNKEDISEKEEEGAIFYGDELDRNNARQIRNIKIIGGIIGLGFVAYILYRLNVLSSIHSYFYS